MGWELFALAGGIGAMIVPTIIRLVNFWHLSRTADIVITVQNRDGATVKMNLDNPKEAELFLEEIIGRRKENSPFSPGPESSVKDALRRADDHPGSEGRNDA